MSDNLMTQGTKAFIWDFLGKMTTHGMGYFPCAITWTFWLWFDRDGDGDHRDRWSIYRCDFAI